MDATCAIQNSIHVFSLVHINMCPGFWVHIRGRVGVFDCVYIGKTDVEQSGVCPAHAGNSRMYVTVGETDALFYCE